MEELALQSRLSEEKNNKTYHESHKAYQAYLDYRAMGVKRSLRKLHESYTAPDAPSNCPTKRLSSLETWSARWRWQERIEDWIDTLATSREKEEKEARLEERQKRTKLLNKMRKIVKEGLDSAKLKTEDDVKKFNALMRAMKNYMELSMKQYNDLPTQRTDLTSDNKPLAVEFNITPPDD